MQHTGSHSWPNHDQRLLLFPTSGSDCVWLRPGFVCCTFSFCVCSNRTKEARVAKVQTQRAAATTRLQPRQKEFRNSTCCLCFCSIEARHSHSMSCCCCCCCSCCLALRRNAFVPVLLLMWLALLSELELGTYRGSKVCRKQSNYNLLGLPRVCGFFCHTGNHVEPKPAFSDSFARIPTVYQSKPPFPVTRRRNKSQTAA